MPILERDPWRFQYFTDIECPDDIIVPTDDIDAWPLNPEHNWVYDRMRLALSQGLQAGPHGTVPPTYPVFSKPIVNLRGMGIGSRLVATGQEMMEASTAGHFWMPVLAGAHLSTDCAIVRGDVQWLRSCKGEPTDRGMFRHWTLMPQSLPEFEFYLATWVGHYLPGYTGMLNVETIGGKFIEMHLRFSDQWCDLYGDGWIEAVVNLYANGQWDWTESKPRQGFSIPLFAKPDRSYRHPPLDVQARVRAMPEIASLQLTFHDHVEPALHAMPPGGMRLALVNCWNLEAGHAALTELAKCFPADAIISAD